jgi:hypothetical protein
MIANGPERSAVERILAIKKSHEQQLARIPNVVGSDVGFKYVGGKRTDEIAIRLFVSKKGDVSAESAIPKEIEGVKTDVIEQGRISPQWLKRALTMGTAVDPLVGGISVGPCRVIGGEIYAGTLGAIVRTSSGAVAALSNFHVSGRH